jgi:hypothetical protein
LQMFFKQALHGWRKITFSRRRRAELVKKWDAYTLR